MGDLDVETVHAVVFDLQIGDPGAGTLARLERDQEFTTVIVDRSQLVEFGIEARRDHAAVAHLCRGLGRDRAREEPNPLRIDGQRLRQ